VLASTAATMTAFMGLYAGMPLLMETHGLGAGSYGTVAMANAASVLATSALLGPWIGRAVARRPRVDLLILAGLWTTVCMAAVGLVTNLSGYLLAAIAFGVSETIWFVVATDIVHRIAPAERRGWYHGAWGSMLALAAVLSPLLATASFAWGGAHTFAVTTLLVGAFGALLCLPLARMWAAVGKPSDSSPSKRRMK
jgi:MFS family permease